MAKFKTYDQFLNEAEISQGLAEHFSYMENGRLVLHAIFAMDSPIAGISPGQSEIALEKMPDIVEDAGYLGEGDGIGWQVILKKGIPFKEAWLSLHRSDLKFTGLDSMVDGEPYFISVGELLGTEPNLRGEYVATATGIF